MDGLQIYNIDLTNEKEKDEVRDFLKKFQLNYEDNVDYTIIARKSGNIAATCSKSKNILKCFAVAPELQGEGITATLITALIDKLFEEGIYHSFIFTKPKNIDIFASLNYKLLYEAEKVALLENGIYNIDSYINKIIKKEDIDIREASSAIVMNCNPFTKGHEYLIEKASTLSKQVLVFIVEEDKSLFPFKARYDMVKKGTAHLGNVKVIPGGEYIISQATFPSYFLRQEDDMLKAYTSIDAGIFGRYFCKKLNINRRFVGEEPYCKVTNAYNEALLKELSKFNVELTKIPRKEMEEEAISASRVRRLIKEGNLKMIKDLVPKVTWEFLNTNEGEEIVERIKESDSPH